MEKYDILEQIGYKPLGHALICTPSKLYFDVFQCDDLRIVVVEINTNKDAKDTPLSKIVAMIEPDSILHGKFGCQEIPSLLSINHLGGQYSVISIKWEYTDNPFLHEKLFDFHGNEINDESIVEAEYKRLCKGNKRPTKLHLSKYEPHKCSHVGAIVSYDKSSIGFIDKVNGRTKIWNIDINSDLGRIINEKKLNFSIYRVTYHKNLEVNHYFLIEKYDDDNVCLHAYNNLGLEESYH